MTAPAGVGPLRFADIANLALSLKASYASINDRQSLEVDELRATDKAFRDLLKACEDTPTNAHVVELRDHAFTGHHSYADRLETIDQARIGTDRWSNLVGEMAGLLSRSQMTLLRKAAAERGAECASEGEHRLARTMPLASMASWLRTGELIQHGANPKEGVEKLNRSQRRRRIAIKRQDGDVLDGLMLVSRTAEHARGGSANFELGFSLAACLVSDLR